MRTLIPVLENHRCFHEMRVLASLTQGAWRSWPQQVQATTFWPSRGSPARGKLRSASERTEGWATEPSLTLPTMGASDVAVADVLPDDETGYLSQVIRPRDPVETGAFEVLKYELASSSSIRGTIDVVDADTWEVLVTSPLGKGPNEIVLRHDVSVRDHPAIRIHMTLRGVGAVSDLVVDDLWLNWSKRVKLPPRVDGLSVDPPTVKRQDECAVEVAVSDEFDLPSALTVTVEARLNPSGTWTSSFFGDLEFADGNWSTTFRPPAQTVLGMYDIRVLVVDVDLNESEPRVFPNAVEVLNNPPSPPLVSIEPVRPVTTDSLTVSIDRRGLDRENEGVSYRYAWFVDGELQADLTSVGVDPSLTAKGQNWSVEVRSFDGHDTSSPATAWVVVQNSPPRRTGELPPLSVDEDSGPREWLNLSDHFTDPDGDALEWVLDPEPVHITASVEGASGSVVIEPEEDWYGTEILTFVVTDGEFYANGSGVVTVRPVDDGPSIAAVNGIGVTGAVVELTATQGRLMVINVTIIDKEGNELVYVINNSRLTFHGDPRNISLLPDNDDVGVLRFNLRVSEADDPTMWDELDFVITVENANDPMALPEIVAPFNGSRFLANETFWLNGSCFDPDLAHGQTLVFSWTSNLSGDLGEGNSIEVTLGKVGVHTITLRVDDGEYREFVTIEVVIYKETPPPPPPPTVDDETPWALITVVLVIVVIALVGALAVARRSKEAVPAVEVEEVEELSEEDRKEAFLSEMAGIAGEAADDLQDGEREGNLRE